MTTRSQKNSVVCLALLALSALSLSAQSTTPWAGYVTDTITPGTGTSYSNSVLSFPLQGVANLTGQMVGQVTSVTANTVTNSSAGWTPGTGTGTLSNTSAPSLIQFTSGTAAGRTFLISTSTGVDSTGTILTLDPADLATTTPPTALTSIVSPGDTYQIIPCDTISNVFGAGTATGVAADGVSGAPLGSGSSATSDILQILNGPGGAWITYFYNTTTNPPAWYKVGGIAKVSNDVPIRPDAAVLYQRLASQSYSITMTGRVPSVNRQSLVSNVGSTFLSANWPISTTLLASNIQNLPNWTTGTQATQTSADTVQIYNGAAWKQYYYNPTPVGSTGAAPTPGWISAGGIQASGNSVNVPAGGAILIIKKGAASAASIISQTLPYSP